MGLNMQKNTSALFFVKCLNRLLNLGHLCGKNVTSLMSSRPIPTINYRKKVIIFCGTVVTLHRFYGNFFLRFEGLINTLLYPYCTIGVVGPQCGKFGIYVLISIKKIWKEPVLKLINKVFSLHRLPCKVDRLEGFVMLWKKDSNIITVGTQIIDTVRTHTNANTKGQTQTHSRRENNQ